MKRVAKLDFMMDLAGLHSGFRSRGAKHPFTDSMGGGNPPTLLGYNYYNLRESRGASPGNFLVLNSRGHF